MTLRLLHLSDLHFGPPLVPAVCEAVIERARALAPDAVVVSGDLSQRARPREFDAAREFLGRLPAVPRLVVPGNHDVPLFRPIERLARPLEAFRRSFPDGVDGVLDLPGARVVGLDSTDPRRAITGGRITDEQLRFCERAFEDRDRAEWRIVTLHHQLVPSPSYRRPRPLPRARQLLDRLTRLRVDLVLGGHLHRAYLGNSLDVHGGSDREHGIIVVQCGTSTSRRGRGAEREKNSFNFVEIDGERVVVTHHLYFRAEHGFVPVSRHEFARASRGTIRGVGDD